MGSLVFRIAGSGGGGGTCADGSWVTGKVGSYALEFGGDGSGDFVAIPVGASTGSSTGLSGSVAAWIYPTAYSNNETIFFHGDDYWNSDYLFFGLDSTAGKLKYGFKVNGSQTTWYSTDAVPLNQWSHVALTVNGASWPADCDTFFYINGTQSATTGGRTDLSKWINDLHSAKGHALSSIGRQVWGGPYPISWAGATHNEFEGKIDEVGIWTEVVNLGGMQTLYNGGSGAACSTVSSSYLQAHYNMEEGAGNGTLTDRTGNGHTGTLTNMNTGSC